MGDLSEQEPVVIVSGQGAEVTDSLGRTFIDAHAALWLCNAGFGRSEIVDAAHKQMKKLSYFPSLHFLFLHSNFLLLLFLFSLLGSVFYLAHILFELFQSMLI